MEAVAQNQNFWRNFCKIQFQGTFDKIYFTVPLGPKELDIKIRGQQKKCGWVFIL